MATEAERLRVFNKMWADSGITTTPDNPRGKKFFDAMMDSMIMEALAIANEKSPVPGGVPEPLRTEIKTALGAAIRELSDVVDFVTSEAPKELDTLVDQLKALNARL